MELRQFFVTTASVDELKEELQKRGYRADPVAVTYSTPFQDVSAFHAKMGLPKMEDGPPRFMTHSEMTYRVNFIFEELREFIEGHATQSMVDCADALADMAWVVYGMAHYMRVPLDDVWEEIRKANMGKRPWKEGDPVKARNYTAGEVVKPHGWTGPRIDLVLARHKARLQGINLDEVEE